MRLYVDGKEWTPKESDSYNIEYWYDVHQKYWVIQIFDNNNIEQESVVGIKRQGLKAEIDYYKNKYSTTDVKKV